MPWRLANKVISANVFNASLSLIDVLWLQTAFYLLAIIGEVFQNHCP